MRVAVSILALSAVLLLGSGVAVADNDIGCGLGTQIWEGNKGLGAKLAGSFTNGLTFQSISITFGLINCDGRNEVTADARQMRLNHYASVYFDRLAEEMAMGGGEHLDALATLLDVPTDGRDAFAAMTQRRFGELFSHDHVTVGEMLTSLDRLMVEERAVTEAAG